MTNRIKNWLLGLWILIVLGICFNIGIQETPQPLKQAVDNVVVITIKAKATGVEGLYENTALGIPIGNGTILAGAHAMKPPEFAVIVPPFGASINIPYKYEWIKWYVGDKPLTFIGSKGDLAVLHGDIDTVFPFKWADSDTIKLGDEVVLIGRTYGFFINIKKGIISVDPDFFVASQEKKLKINLKLMRSFVITAPVNPGDSGGPVLVYINGKYEIAGMTFAFITGQDVGVLWRSNSIVRVMEDIVNEYRKTSERQ